MAGKVVTVSDDEFDSSILNGDKPSLIDFWAEWCQPCKMLAPTVEEIAGEYEDKILVGKLNVDAVVVVAGNGHRRAAGVQSHRNAHAWLAGRQAPPQIAQAAR